MRSELEMSRHLTLILMALNAKVCFEDMTCLNRVGVLCSIMPISSRCFHPNGMENRQLNGIVMFLRKSPAS